MRSLRFGLVALPLALVSIRSQDDGRAARVGLVTLYALDDLQSSFDLRHGQPGGHVEDGEIRLTDAQIAFDLFSPGRISFGFVRNERVEVLDLGATRIPPQVRATDRASEFPLSLFHSLFFDGVRFGYVGPGGDRHTLDAADRILGSVPPETLRHVDPVLDHVYLVRVHREGVGGRDEFFKFQVVDLVAEQSVTIRWESLGEG